MTKYIAAILLAASALTATANAAPVAFSNTLTIGAGSVGGIGVGGTGTVSFTYDNALLSAGVEFIGAGLSNFTLTFGTLSVTDATDPLASGSLLVSFVSGAISTISDTFTGGSFAYSSTAPANFSVSSGTSSATGIPVSSTPVAPVTGSTVPEPTTLALLGLAMVGLTAARRRV